MAEDSTKAVADNKANVAGIFDIPVNSKMSALRLPPKIKYIDGRYVTANEYMTNGMPIAKLSHLSNFGMAFGL